MFFKNFLLAFILPLTVLGIPHARALDMNGDGISDVYASFYPAPAGVTLDKAVDFDGDGQITGDEAAAGTDWRNPASLFTSKISGTSSFSLEWFGVIGKRYQYVSSPDLLPPWTPGGTPLIGAGANLSVSLTDATGFWRVSILPSLDSDDDLLDAYEEGLLGTSDTSADTDNDGNSDAQEFAQGTNPNDNTSYALPQIVKTGGDNQASTAGVVAPVPFSVKVTGTGGMLLPHVPITYSVLSGGGSLTPAVDDPTALSTEVVYTGVTGEGAVFYRQPPTTLVTSQIQASVRAGAQNASVTFTTQTTPAPANDMFATATAISGASSSIQQSNAGATVETSEPEHAQVSEGSTVWFDWTAPSNGDFQFITNGSDFDTVLGIYTGTAVGALTNVAANDDEESIVPRVFSSRVALHAISGQHYKIAVAGYKQRTGMLTLAWQTSTGPVNDMFVNATAISGLSGTITGSNIAATLEGGEPTHDGQMESGSVWYSYTPTVSGLLTVTTTGSNFHTVLAAYTGTAVSSLTAVASNTNAAPGVTTSKIFFPVTQGVTYRIAVAGTVEARGSISLQWNMSDYNDNFSQAITISGTSGQALASNAYATKETGEPDHAGNPGGASMWYSWQAPSTDTVQIDTNGSNFYTVLGVYTGSTVSGLTEVASDEISGNAGSSLVQFSAVAGTVYKIAVDGYYGDRGNLVLNWTQPAPPMEAAASTQGGTSSLTAEPSSISQETGAEKDARLYGSMHTRFAAMSSDDECDEGPPEANKGEVVYIDSNGQSQTSRTVYVAIGPPKKPQTTPETCPQSVTVQHKIITTNTPRARDLPGKLTLTLKSGDSTVVEVKNNGAAYTLGTPIDVLETGHQGCGVHDWHTGTEAFTFEGKKKGTVVFEAACDPDPDDGGDGQATTKLQITVTVFELKLTFDPQVSDVYGISAKAESGFPGFDDTSTKEKITVTTDPANIAPNVDLKVDGFDPDYNSDYSPDDAGTLTKKSSTEWEYVSFEEKKSEKKTKPKKAIIRAKVDDSEFCLEYKILVKPVFKWLVELHQHGPGAKRHVPQASDYETAYKYAKWKYDIDTSNLTSITYGGAAPTGSDALAATDMSSNSGPRATTIYTSAFDQTENVCASALGHENVHGGQSMNAYLRSYLGQWTGDFNSKIEYPAYKWQVDNADACGLSEGEKADFSSKADKTKNGQNP